MSADPGGQQVTDLRRINRGKCSSCGAEILWAESKNGFAMPIDPTPVEDGNVVLHAPDDPRESPLARVLKKGEHAPMPRFTSHFATCPDAAEHRKK